MVQIEENKLKILTWLLRLAVGALFIFSGFVKAIDPWGTIYKVQDYLAAMEINLWDNLILTAVFGLCATEFIVGVFLITGCLRRSTPIAAFIIMLFMTPLSLWVALKDPVPDCGCFGDVIIISNWSTFYKNLLIVVGTIYLIRFNKRTTWLITPALQWIMLLSSIIFVFAIELFGYNFQPLLDFRKYPKGVNLISEVQEMNESEYRFIYKKGQEEKIIGENDDLPTEEDGWTFVRREKISEDKNADEFHDVTNFRIWSKDGDEDMTEDALANYKELIMLMIPDIKQVSPSTTWKLNAIYDWATEKGIGMIGIVAGSIEEINDWDDLAMPSYEVYSADDTQIKEIVRGNPAIVFLEEGVIKGKTMLSAVDVDNIYKNDTSYHYEKFDVNTEIILFNCIAFYLIIVSVLIGLSFTPHLARLIATTFNHRLIHDGKVHHEE